MKLLLLMIALVCSVSAATNTNAVATLNRHEIFYANYRTQKARLERGIAELKEAIDKDELLRKKKQEAGLDWSAEMNRWRVMATRQDQLKRQLATLDVARLEYEKKNPGAERFARSPQVTTRIGQSTPRRPIPVTIVTNR